VHTCQSEASRAAFGAFLYFAFVNPGPAGRTR
jgi:hypothetical protein